jgi:hypothetical protein
MGLLLRQQELGRSRRKLSGRALCLRGVAVGGLLSVRLGIAALTRLRTLGFRRTALTPSLDWSVLIVFLAHSLPFQRLRTQMELSPRPACMRLNGFAPVQTERLHWVTACYNSMGLCNRPYRNGWHRNGLAGLELKMQLHIDRGDETIRAPIPENGSYAGA